MKTWFHRKSPWWSWLKKNATSVEEARSTDLLWTDMHFGPFMVMRIPTEGVRDVDWSYDTRAELMCEREGFAVLYYDWNKYGANYRFSSDETLAQNYNRSQSERRHKALVEALDKPQPSLRGSSRTFVEQLRDEVDHEAAAEAAELARQKPKPKKEAE